VPEPIEKMEGARSPAFIPLLRFVSVMVIAPSNAGRPNGTPTPRHGGQMLKGFS